MEIRSSAAGRLGSNECYTRSAPMPLWTQRMVPWLCVNGTLAVALLAFFPTIVTGQDVFFCRDQAGLIDPLWTYARQRIHQGQLPIWLPYEGLGVPFVGSTVSGVFNPLLWLLSGWETQHALRLWILLDFCLAFGSVFALARQCNIPRFAAVTASLLYAFGGSFVSLVNNPLYLSGAALYPLFLFGVATFQGGRRLGGSLLAAGTLVLMILCGDLQSAYASGIVGCVWVLLTHDEVGIAGALRQLAWLGAVAAVRSEERRVGKEGRLGGSP